MAERQRPDDGPPPWVIVAGGFHSEGGMDKANAALAMHLVRNGSAVELVAHRIDRELSEHPRVTSHLVPLPRGSFLWGERLLEHKGQSVARQAEKNDPRTRVVVNGGNCVWAGINWVHYVHHAWRPPLRGGGPGSLKHAVAGKLFRRNELRALGAAKLVIANSERTRRDLIELAGVPAARIQTIYLGNDTSWNEPDEKERAGARERFQLEGDHPVVVFVGAMGSDQRKGFDTLWEAWRMLCGDPSWDAELLVAGGGRTIPSWEQKTARAGLAERIRFLGFITDVDRLLAAADLLVSPVRYEAYGLNVQEAICRGLPAIVTASAGIAEKYPASLGDLLVRDPDDPAELAQALRRWRSEQSRWKHEFSSLGASFRTYSWDEMAAEIVRVVDRRFP